MEQTGLGPDKMPGLKTKAGFMRRRLAGYLQQRQEAEHAQGTKSGTAQVETPNQLS